MINFSKFLLETPSAIVGNDAEEIRNQMTSFIVKANTPASSTFNSIRKNVKNIGNDYYMRKVGFGSRASIELYRASNNKIEFITFISVTRFPNAGKCMVLESIAKLNQNVHIDNGTYLDTLLFIKDNIGAELIVSDKDHTQGANHLWIKIMSIAKNNGREIGAFNTLTNVKTQITSQSVALAIRKSGYTTQQNIVLYIK